MRIPSTFKKVIASTFYDKDVTICHKVVRRDPLGAIVMDGYEAVLSVKASVQPASSDVMTAEFGQSVDATKRIACDLPESAVDETDDVVLYNGSYYDIKGKLPTDSALILMVKEVTR